MDAQFPAVSVPFVDLAAQHDSLQADLSAAIAGVFRNSDFILGQSVAAFEQEFASYTETSYAVGVDSGSSALELGLRAFGIGPGDEVITAANTFIATVLAISHVGANPVLVDVDPRTYTMEPAQLESAITQRTKAVIPVHLYGQSADMDPILTIAERHNLFVLEDACQAHGARYKGRRIGALGHAAAFSFYPAKNLGAAGDAGMLVTSDAEIAHSVRMLRDYGQSKKYNHEVRGFNRRLDTIQAAVLSVKLRHLEDWNALRIQHAKSYSSQLASLDGFLVLPEVADYADHVFHLFVVRVQQRSALMSFLSSLGVNTGVHYPVPVHLQPAYRDLGYGPGCFPIAERYAQEILSLPMYPELCPESIRYVCAAIGDFAATMGARLDTE